MGPIPHPSISDNQDAADASVAGIDRLSTAQSLDALPKPTLPFVNERGCELHFRGIGREFGGASNLVQGALAIALDIKITPRQGEVRVRQVRRKTERLSRGGSSLRRELGVMIGVGQFDRTN